jgi:hypothetical protein
MENFSVDKAFGKLISTILLFGYLARKIPPNTNTTTKYFAIESKLNVFNKISRRIKVPKSSWFNCFLIPIKNIIKISNYSWRHFALCFAAFPHAFFMLHQIIYTI